MLINLQRVAGPAGLLFLVLAFVAGPTGSDNLGWLLVAISAFLLALSLFTGSRASLPHR